ncbi:spermidine/putrescine ABC transporter permease [Rhodobacter sp. TJ_12]|uniref:ABC transporter permease n=1 Tax=Rhodobacter sp. TJ_12 TaxID=2029399 RepID=UPI001CBC9411|nr:ABC transporter permease [Rhodobacter sp. TJ_12]MBZ4022930.1 spermidine/putrescine ABC transporter permease [Rhodobacter sp. TJ_12]
MSASPLRRLARSETANGYLMVSPTLLYAMLLLAAPLITIFAYSFFKDGYLEVIHEFTLSNYVEAWSDPIFRAILLRSVIVSGLVTFVTVVLAFPIAYFISFNLAPAHKARWLFLITIPFWTSYLIRVFQWKVILSYNGVINSLLMGAGIIDEPLQMLNSIGAIAVTLAHAYAPFAILPIFVSLEKIDRSLLEAGQDLGESRLMTFWRVTLPLAMPGVIGAVMIVFIPTIGDYVTPVIIGGGKLPMVANMIQMDMLKIDNKPLGSAIAVSSMLVVAAIALTFLFLNRRFLRGPK